jgi:hypothetical protein
MIKSRSLQDSCRTVGFEDFFAKKAECVAKNVRTFLKSIVSDPDRRLAMASQSPHGVLTANWF